MKPATINAGQFTEYPDILKIHNSTFAFVHFAIYSADCHKHNQHARAARRLAIYKALLDFIELCISVHHTHRYHHHTGRLIRNAAQQRYEYRGTLWFHPLK